MARKQLRKQEENMETLAPQKGSQALAMNIKADVIIYGGAANNSGCVKPL